MSRYAAKVVADTGEVRYGLYNGTVEHMQPRLFPTIGERDQWWEAEDWYDEWYQCGCTTGIPCLVADDQYDPITVWRGQVCLAHACFLGPYSPNETEPDPRLPRTDWPENLQDELS